MAILRFCLLALLSLAFAEGNYVFPNKLSFLGGSFNVSFNFNESSDTLEFLVEVNATGWVGFGFAEKAPNNMTDYDVAVGGVFPNGSGYLKIIHRDLAARNVLLDKNCECKVTDFGLSYQNFKYGHDNAKKDCMPVKWTAPEILFGDASNLSTKSDVWSYGVVLYEIFTIGGIPYPGWSEAKTMAELQKGYRMPKPPHIADTMYHLMERCWQENPDFRPNFENIRKDLLSLIEKQLYLGLLDESKYDGTKYSMVEDVCAASLMPRPNKKWSSLKFDQSLPLEEPISDSLPSYWI